MATPPYPGSRLDVTADLTVTVDGLTSTVTGSGSDLRVETADPARLLDTLADAELPSGVGRVDGPRALGRLAEVLRAAGVRVTVTGPRGDVLAMGDVPPAWTGRLLTGSRSVRMGSWSAVRPLVLASARRRVPLGRRAVVAVTVVLATAGLVRHRRRTTGS
jgi:hypothetical protein